MSGSALVWTDESTLRLLHVAGAAIVIGRSADAGVRLNDPSVSRQHALLRGGGPSDRLENLSRTNPVKVNGERIDEPVSLSDGDVLKLGNVEVMYHRLASAKRVSGPVCSHCARENPANQRDCWFCGTSLVNALSAARTWTAVAFRAAARPPDAATDVYTGETLLIGADGAMHVERVRDEPQGAAAIAVLDGPPVIRRLLDQADIAVNDSELTDERQLRTGDVIRAGTGLAIVLVGTLSG